MNRKKYHIFCDESCLTHRYSCYGDVIISNNTLDMVNNTINAVRKEQTLFAELKWSKISNQYNDKYEILINHVASLINKDMLHFRSIIIDNHKINYTKYSNGDKEIGLYKFYFQLLKHCFLKNANNAEYEIYIDQRITNIISMICKIILIMSSSLLKLHQ